MDRYFGVILLLSLAAYVAGITIYYMDHMCGFNKVFENATIRLRLTSKSSYRPNMNCLLTLTTTSNSKLMLYFMDVDIEHSTTCSDDYLDVLDGNKVGYPYVAGIKGRLCGKYMDKYVYVTSNDAMLLHFASNESSDNSGFDMVITTYHTGRCYVSEYECDNGRCISNNLTCNGYNPCGDYSDCPSEVHARGLKDGAIAGIVVAAVLFVFFVIAGTIKLSKRRQRQRSNNVGGHIQKQNESSPLHGYMGPHE